MSSYDDEENSIIEEMGQSSSSNGIVDKYNTGSTYYRTRLTNLGKQLRELETKLGKVENDATRELAKLVASNMLKYAKNYLAVYWYGGYRPKRYQRTYEFMNSLTFAVAHPNQYGYSISIYWALKGVPDPIKNTVIYDYTKESGHVVRLKAHRAQEGELSQHAPSPTYEKVYGSVNDADYLQEFIQWINFGIEGDPHEVSGIVDNPRAKDAPIHLEDKIISEWSANLSEKARVQYKLMFQGNNVFGFKKR